MRAYRRNDGLYDIEGHIVDTKPLECSVPFGPLVSAGDSIHEMWIRLTIDRRMVVREAIAVTDAAPYTDCVDASRNFLQLVGTQIGTGWMRTVRDLLGGTKGCTHVLEMLTPLSSAAYQAMWPEWQGHEGQLETLDINGRPVLLDTCWSMASDRELALIRWPEHYTGPALTRRDSAHVQSPDSTPKPP